MSTCECNPLKIVNGNCTCKKQHNNKMFEEKEMVNHPDHYQFGKNDDYEVIKVVDAWDLGFSLGNTVKYISRAGKKIKEKEIEDLEKALWYLTHRISQLKK